MKTRHVQDIDAWHIEDIARWHLLRWHHLQETISWRDRWQHLQETISWRDQEMPSLEMPSLTPSPIRSAFHTKQQLWSLEMALWTGAVIENLTARSAHLERSMEFVRRFMVPGVIARANAAAPKSRISYRYKSPVPMTYSCLFGNVWYRSVKR